MHHHDSRTSVLGAVALIALLVAVGACVVLGVRRHRWRRVLLVGVAAGALFQFGHLSEHVAQAGYWAANRSDAPWMTPWAAALARSFGRLAPGTPAFEMEGLHLVGNAIFLADALAVLIAVSRLGPSGSRPPARQAVWVETVHVLEHVALTTSVVVSGRAIGISTLFGTLDPAPGLWTYRVWWHLAINAIASALLLLAIVRWRRHEPSTPSARRRHSSHHDHTTIRIEVHATSVH